MDWRLLSAVASVSASLGVASFSAYTVLAADAITPESGAAAPSLISRDTGSRSGAPQQSSVLRAARDPSRLVNGGTVTPSADLGLAAATEIRPAPLAEPAVHGCLRHDASDVKPKYARPCVVSERRTPLVARRDGSMEERGTRRIALVLGIAF
jgi:hypothetical protein